MIRTTKLGRKYEPETLEARKTRALELFKEGKDTKAIQAALRQEFHGVAIGAGTLTEMKVKHLKVEHRIARKNRAQMELPLTANTKTQLSKAAQFAVEVAAAGGSCTLDLNSEKLEITFR